MRELTKQATHRSRRGLGPILAVLLCVAGPAAGKTDLPDGFGSLRVGDRWVEPPDREAFRDLADRSRPWNRYVSECGYRQLAIGLDSGQLLVTVHDFVVTALSYVTSIDPDSKLLEVADLVIESYGQPAAATMRDLFGHLTIDSEEVNSILLRYDARNPVEFAISGRGLWQYQVTVRFAQRRWHENKTYRCARAREATASGNG